MSVSFQLYSSRSVPSQTEFLGTLADLGYAQVEGYGGVYDDPQAFRAAMDAAGLAMPSGHVGLADLEDDFQATLGTAKALGISRLFVPYLDASERPTDSAGYATFAQRLAEVGKRATDAGFSFGWHNHDFELKPLEDGGMPLDIILNEASEIDWEGDLAWIARAGVDPVAWVQKYGERLTAIHVKDIAPDGTNLDQDGWCDVGEGTIDWPGLIAAVRSVAPDALHVMEHDNPADPVAFAAASMRNFKTF